jgi:acetolactate synthase-1/2/3 large subunit
VVDGGGTITQITFQAFKVKKGQRLMIDAGLCAMGSGLPQSIGACFARNKKRTICLCGDGSFQFNVQDLQTIAHHHLPIKIFIINNNGYLAIRHTQDQFFNRHFVGTEERGGVSFPDILKVGRAYGIKGIRIRRNKGMGKIITDVLAAKGPVLCEIMVPRDHEVAPRQGFDHISGATYVARPLEDMYPFLDRKEFSNNMIVKEYKSGS